MRLFVRKKFNKSGGSSFDQKEVTPLLSEKGKVLNHNMCIVLPKYYGFGGEREKSIFLLKDLKKIYAEIVDL